MRNNKGYVMIEALIISAVVLTTLVLVYMQFAKLNQHYNDSYYFNNVNDIYALNQIADYLNDESLSSYTSSLTTYVAIKDNTVNCNNVSKTAYCNKILTMSNVKYLLLAKRGRNALVNALKVNNPYDIRLYNFISTIDDSDETYTYMLIGEFNDGTYAAIPFNA